MWTKRKILIYAILAILFFMVMVVVYFFRPLRDAEITYFEWTSVGNNECGLEGVFTLTRDPADKRGYLLKGKKIFDHHNKKIGVIKRQYYFEGVVATIYVRASRTKKMCLYADAHMSPIW